jgi:hypothetical protein
LTPAAPAASHHTQPADSTKKSKLIEEVTTPPYFQQLDLADVTLNSAFFLKFKGAGKEISGEYRSPWFGLSIIFSIGFQIILLFVSLNNNLKISPYWNLVLLGVSIGICSLLKKNQTVKRLSIRENGDLWFGQWEEKQFAFQSCLLLTTNLFREESGDFSLRYSRNMTSQLLFFKDEAVVFSFSFGTCADPVAKEFSKKMPTTVYLGNFYKKYWKEKLSDLVPTASLKRKLRHANFNPQKSN